MRKEILYSLRDKLKAYFPDFTHIIGVRDVIKQSDYPFISYVYTGEQPEGDNQTVLRIHLYFGILQKSFDTTTDEYKGHSDILQVIEDIKAFIYKNRVFAQYVLDSKIERIATDGGLQHPKYEGEIILLIKALDKPPKTEPKATKITVLNTNDNILSEVVL